MAIRAKLSAPKEVKSTWPWHEVKWTAIPASVLAKGDRRMEADNYLSSGYGLRLALVQQHAVTTAFTALADVWQPSRLKGIQVSRDYGTPFLAATQVFDLRPSPRKFLALERTDSAEERFIKNGTIVITCSGSVGRSTLAYAAHEGVLISHDLLRVSPRNPKHWGWLYSYLRTESARAMLGSAQYGHMIKHLEPSHVGALPILLPNDQILEGFQRNVERILELRNRAWQLQLQAEALFASSVGGIPKDLAPLDGFSVSASNLFNRRRRLEATYHSPSATRLLDQFSSRQLQIEPLAKVSERVWWLTRFKRVFGESGDRYLSADELFSINPPTTKRVLAGQADNPEEYRVKAGWIVMACSGQTYGLNGSVALMTKSHEDAFFSHDLIRIVPKNIRPGYLFTVLGHPELGRPLVLRNAYGTSIPHLDPDDVAQVPVVRVSHAIEEEIADLMEEAILCRSRADTLEDDQASRAEELVQALLSGHLEKFTIVRHA